MWTYLQMFPDMLHKKGERKVQFSQIKSNSCRIGMFVWHVIYFLVSTLSRNWNSHHVLGVSWWGWRWQWPCHSLGCLHRRRYHDASCCWLHCCSSAEERNGFHFGNFGKFFLANIMGSVIYQLPGGSLVVHFIGGQDRLLNSHGFMLFLQCTLNFWVLSKLLVCMICKEMHQTCFKVGQKECTHSLVAQCT